MTALILYSNPSNDLLTKNLFDKVKSELKLKYDSLDISFVDDYDFSYLHDLQEISLSKKENVNMDPLSANPIDLQFINELIKLRSFEVDKIKNCQICVFVFPLTQMFCPAKLKAWFELTLEDGLRQGIDRNQYYKTGIYRNKKAFIVTNTIHEIRDFGSKGQFLLTLEEMLEPITYGILAFSGMTVLNSLLVYKNDTEYNERIEEYIKEISKPDNKEYILYN